MDKEKRSLYKWMQYIGAAAVIVSCCFLLYRFLEELNHPVNTSSVPNGVWMMLLIVGCLLLIITYYKEKGNSHSSMKAPLRRKVKKESVEEKKQKEIVKPVAENEVAAWKVEGMRQYYEKAKYELNVYIRDLEQELKDLTQQERELYIIHDLLMKLMKEMINEKLSLSCVEIYLIFAKLELYHVHHEKRLYESYKVHLSVPQQYHLDMLLDPRTRDIIRFLLKERYAFLPENLADHLSDAVRSMEAAADEGNIYAQFDLANVYLSSEFYGGMEAAVFYLHRADNAHHSGAAELLHQLQSA